MESPTLACDPGGSYVYLTFTEMEKFNPVGGHVIQFARSIDGGVTLQPRVALSGEFAGDARVTVGPDGEVHALWHDYSTGQVLMRTSFDHGASFGLPVVVAPMLDNVDTAPTAWASTYIRRNPYYYLMAGHAVPNAPSVAVDRSGGPRHGTLYATWSEYADGKASATTPVSEIEPNEWYAQATPLAIGQAVAGMAIDPGKLDPGDYDRFYFDGVAGMTLQIEGELTAIGGPQLNSPIAVPVFVLCGEDTTRLRRLASITMTLPEDGPRTSWIYTLPRTGRYYLSTPAASIWSWAYQIRIRELIPSPSSAAQDHRDIVLVRSTDGGATWSGKVRVNDCAPGDDDSFPEVVVDDLGQVHVAWYCKRDEVGGCGTLTNTYWTLSSDGGQSFRPAQRVSSTPSPWECSGGGPNIGDHLGLAAGGGRVHIAWTEVGCPDSVDIYTARVEDIATGIAIGRFEANWVGERVRLAWHVNDGRGIVGFRMHRAGGDAPFESIGEALPYRGDGAYEQFDESAARGVAYHYRLEVLREGGSSTWEGPIGVAVPAAIGRLAWAGAVPNPFRDQVDFELAVPRRGPVRVRVYDVLGHEVAQLHEGDLEPGVHRIRWAGTNRLGRAVAPGVYLVRAEGSDETVVRRVLRLQ